MLEHEVKNLRNFRREIRFSADLKAIITEKRPDAEPLQEVAVISSVSRMGAGFRFSRELPVGRLISLTLHMAKELHAYDQTKDVFTVVGLIQYCHETQVDGETGFDIGVAFTGKTFPAGYKTDPATSYRIAGITKQGLWKIHESESVFKPHAAPRFSAKLDVVISLIQKSRESVVKESTVTRDISISGASFPSTLDTTVGEKVKFACKEFDFYALAIVRNRNVEASTVHLEFIDASFPVNKLAFTSRSNDDSLSNHKMDDRQIIDDSAMASNEFEIIGASF